MPYEQTVHAEEGVAIPPLQWAQADWFLLLLIDMVNGSNAEIGITLQVGGFLVSGLLVGASKYFPGFASEFTGNMHGDPATTETIRSSFSNYGQSDRHAPELAPYIHLKEAKFSMQTGTRFRGTVGYGGGAGSRPYPVFFSVRSASASGCNP